MAERGLLSDPRLGSPSLLASRCGSAGPERRWLLHQVDRVRDVVPALATPRVPAVRDRLLLGGRQRPQVRRVDAAFHATRRDWIWYLGGDSGRSRASRRSDAAHGPTEPWRTSRCDPVLPISTAALVSTARYVRPLTSSRLWNECCAHPGVNARGGDRTSSRGAIGPAAPTFSAAETFPVGKVPARAGTLGPKVRQRRGRRSEGSQRLDLHGRWTSAPPRVIIGGMTRQRTAPKASTGGKAPRPAYAKSIVILPTQEFPRRRKSNRLSTPLLSPSEQALGRRTPTEKK